MGDSPFFQEKFIDMQSIPLSEIFSVASSTFVAFDNYRGSLAPTDFTGANFTHVEFQSISDRRSKWVQEEVARWQKIKKCLFLSKFRVQIVPIEVGKWSQKGKIVSR